MTSVRMSIGPPLVVSILLAMTTLGVWGWRSTVFHTRMAAVKEEPWQHVKEQYPEPGESAPASGLSPEMADALIRANPFDAARRLVPVAETAKTDGGTAQNPAVPAQPQLVYKGLVTLGTKRRAIVEDTTIHKTYFLEVGQEVTGFKVLDIAENRVLLSNLKTNEEIVVSVGAKPSS